jgi:hypothetical protein
LLIDGLPIADWQRDTNRQSTIVNPLIDDPRSTIRNRLRRFR